MTAIAGFSIFGVPFLISDVLWSTAGDNYSNVVLPGSGESVREVDGYCYVPSALQQKTVFIDPHFAVAVVGRYDFARKFLEELKRTVGDDSTELQDDDLQQRWNAALDLLGDEGKEATAFIGLRRRSDDTFSFLAHD
jgi:hypothetical protein